MDASKAGKSMPLLGWLLDRRRDREVAADNLLTKAYIFGFDTLISPANAVVRTGHSVLSVEEDKEF